MCDLKVRYSLDLSLYWRNSEASFTFHKDSTGLFTFALS